MYASKSNLSDGDGYVERFDPYAEVASTQRARYPEDQTQQQPYPWRKILAPAASIDSTPMDMPRSQCERSGMMSSSSDNGEGYTEGGGVLTTKEGSGGGGAVSERRSSNGEEKQLEASQLSRSATANRTHTQQRVGASTSSSLRDNLNSKGRRPHVPRNRGPGSKTVPPPHTSPSSASSYTVSIDGASSRSHTHSLSPFPMAVAPDNVMHSTQRSQSTTAAAAAVGDHSTARLHTGPLKSHAFIAQSAHTQRNPFRTQDFADFVSGPQYEAPANFNTYSEAATMTSNGFKPSLANQGELLIQRIVDVARVPGESARERRQVQRQLLKTLDTMQAGTWFYKWDRNNKVDRRYVWLNIDRGTLMWSRSLAHSIVFNSEVKLCSVTEVKPDCIQDAPSGRSFYRMAIHTPSRTVCLATELREKFDMWFQVLQHITTSNLRSGVPGMYGRPSERVNNTGRGAVGRWASRYSPLQAIVDGSGGGGGGGEGNIGVMGTNLEQCVASSD